MNPMWVFISFHYIAHLSYVAVVIVGLWAFRKQPKEMKILWGLLCIALLIDTLMYYFYRKGIRSFIPFHVYTLFEYSFLMFVFSYWQSSDTLRNVLRFGIILFAVLWLSSKFTFEPFHIRDSFTSSLDMALLAAIAIFTLANQNIDNMLVKPQFWVSVAVLIYAAGNGISFAMLKWAQPSMLKYTGLLNNILTIVANLFYTGGFIYSTSYHTYGRSSSEPHSSSF